MDILPPPDSPLIDPADYPLPPIRTSPAIIDKFLSLCVSGEIESSREVLNSTTSSSGEIHINDLASVMLEAIKRDSVPFIDELLQHGMQPTALRALEAVEAKSKNALDTFIRHGWDINEPLSELKPPVLGYAITDEDMTTLLRGYLSIEGHLSTQSCTRIMTLRGYCSALWVSEHLYIARLSFKDNKGRKGPGSHGMCASVKPIGRHPGN